uniref:lipase family protein n=2 Tax=Campylobacter jejuni TaxID=197 RepID=UPI001E3E9E97
MSKDYKDYFIYDDSLAFYPKLNGEFREIQTQNFAKRYTIKFHQPNTFSGFSATLFYDIQKDEYIVSFRGTEGIVSMDAFADIGLTFGKGDFQANALKQFLLDIAPILNNIDSSKITFVGHSLGGYLAVVAMQLCDTIDRTLCTDFNQIKFSASKVYTFNSPTIDGIDNMLMRFLANLLGNNIVEQILNPEKIVCVFDNGGVEIIASAQYGASNALGIYTGKNDHSIKPLVNTLYFILI